MHKQLIMRTYIISGIVSLAVGAKILEFDNRREDNTSSRLLNGKRITSPDLSLCVDFKANRVSNMKILTTDPIKDLEVQIPPTLDRFYIQVKGIFYLAPTSKITPYEFATLCFSSLSITQINKLIRLHNDQDGRISELESKVITILDAS